MPHPRRQRLSRVCHPHPRELGHVPHHTQGYQAIYAQSTPLRQARSSPYYALAPCITCHLLTPQAESSSIPPPRYSLRQTTSHARGFSNPGPSTSSHRLLSWPHSRPRWPSHLDHCWYGNQLLRRAHPPNGMHTSHQHGWWMSTRPTTTSFCQSLHVPRNSTVASWRRRPCACSTPAWALQETASS